VAQKYPLCLYGGDIKELQWGDTLPNSGSYMPLAGGTMNASAVMNMNSGTLTNTASIGGGSSASLTFSADATAFNLPVALTSKTATEISALSPAGRALLLWDSTNGNAKIYSPLASAWQALCTTATILTGLSTATVSAITSADTYLIAFGKLQAQITSLWNGFWPYRAITGSDSLVATDAGKRLEISASGANTFTFASGTLPAVGTSGYFSILGVGQTTFAVSGVTLRCPLATPKSGWQGAIITWTVNSDSTVTLSGDLV
jgi:hypothetical protein